MITGYKQLTGKYLKSSKKRTILTIIGIVLSVALIASIGLFIAGMQEAEIENIKSSIGSWHLQFSNADNNLISEVTNNPKVSRSGLFRVDYKEKLGNKLVVDEVTATDNALELMSYKVKQGRLPQNTKEAAVESFVLKQIDNNAKVGDKIKFNNKEYTLVGVLEDTVRSQIGNEGVLLTKTSNIDKNNSTMLVEISSKTNLGKAVEELKQLGKKGTVLENSYLLGFEGAGGGGSSFNGLYLAAAVIISIVLIATIAVIYNSFQISVVERIKQFGLLRAVGATPKQIRKLVLREATVLAVISIPIGLLLSIAVIYTIDIVFRIIGGNSVSVIKPVIPFKVMAISGVVGVAATYVSAFIPALFAGSISPLVAINSRTSITKEKIKRRNSKIVQKIFGFEGALASKNIKRNRKRYRITIFSIVISVALFVTFKSFLDMALNIKQNVNESRNIHFVVEPARKTGNSMQSIKTNLDDNIIQNIESIKSISQAYKVYDLNHFYAAIDKNSEIKAIQDMKTVYSKTTLNNNEKSLLNGGLEIYDTASLTAAKKYLHAGTLDVNRLNNENGVIIINKNHVYNNNTKKTYVGPIANIKVGDEIDLQYVDFSKPSVGFGKGAVKKAKVMAILNDDPFDFLSQDENQLKLITTEQVAKNLMGVSDVKPNSLNITIKDIKNENTVKTEIETAVKSNPSLNVIDMIDNNRNMKSGTLMVQILIYGFVVVVSLIGSVNIVNTLTTNIILRKREFAALKSIGLTQKGLRKMIVLEGIFYGIVGTIYGSITGTALSYLLFKSLRTAREFTWNIPWNAMGIAAICSIVIGYISVLSPLKRINKENLIEVIREDS
ncbi:ABC transporter permease [Clostridium pasteurianum]|uniref:ABC-type transport system, involved in lipoprotein release, permease component n=1 Tax=Clostridium pasteurianum BC1 TaxID=86416 RepID=R4KGH3_CLOPA|nr:FtsX-like permease family protein [Clostridium pasteurianum]AGK98710.1 ABC-type transport system, involved in lipoprotein release, permease component [Clostridium pasteurianum BC1]